MDDNQHLFGARHGEDGWQQPNPFSAHRSALSYSAFGVNPSMLNGYHHHSTGHSHAYAQPHYQHHPTPPYTTEDVKPHQYHTDPRLAQTFHQLSPSSSRLVHAHYTALTAYDEQIYASRRKEQYAAAAKAAEEDAFYKAAFQEMVCLPDDDDDHATEDNAGLSEGASCTTVENSPKSVVDHPDDAHRLRILSIAAENAERMDTTGPLHDPVKSVRSPAFPSLPPAPVVVLPPSPPPEETLNAARLDQNSQPKLEQAPLDVTCPSTPASNRPIDGKSTDFTPADPAPSSQSSNRSFRAIFAMMPSSSPSKTRAAYFSDEESNGEGPLSEESDSESPPDSPVPARVSFLAALSERMSPEVIEEPLVDPGTETGQNPSCDETPKQSQIQATYADSSPVAPAEDAAQPPETGEAIPAQEQADDTDGQRDSVDADVQSVIIEGNECTPEEPAPPSEDHEAAKNASVPEEVERMQEEPAVEAESGRDVPPRVEQDTLAEDGLNWEKAALAEKAEEPGVVLEEEANNVADIGEEADQAGVAEEMKECAKSAEEDGKEVLQGVAGYMDIQDASEPLENAAEPIGNGLQLTSTEDASEPPKEPAEPVEGPNEPIEDAAAPVEAAVEAVESPVEPIEDEIKPIEDTVEPIEDAIRPFEDEVEPVEDEAEPVEDEVEPVEDEVEPVEDEVELPVDAVELIEDTVGPVELIEDTVEPVEETVEPVEDAVEPVEDAVEPVEDAVEPVEDPVEPTQGAPEENVPGPIEDVPEVIADNPTSNEESLLISTLRPTPPLEDPVKVAASSPGSPLLCAEEPASPSALDAALPRTEIFEQDDFCGPEREPQPAEREPNLAGSEDLPPVIDNQPPERSSSVKLSQWPSASEADVAIPNSDLTDDTEPSLAAHPALFQSVAAAEDAMSGIAPAHESPNVRGDRDETSAPKAMSSPRSVARSSVPQDVRRQTEPTAAPRRQRGLFLDYVEVPPVPAAHRRLEKRFSNKVAVERTSKHGIPSTPDVRNAVRPQPIPFRITPPAEAAQPTYRRILKRPRGSSSPAPEELTVRPKKRVRLASPPPPSPSTSSPSPVEESPSRKATLPVTVVPSLMAVKLQERNSRATPPIKRGPRTTNTLLPRPPRMRFRENSLMVDSHGSPAEHIYPIPTNSDLRAARALGESSSMVPLHKRARSPSPPPKTHPRKRSRQGRDERELPFPTELHNPKTRNELLPPLVESGKVKREAEPKVLEPVLANSVIDLTGDDSEDEIGRWDDVGMSVVVTKTSKPAKIESPKKPWPSTERRGFARREHIEHDERMVDPRPGRPFVHRPSKLRQDITAAQLDLPRESVVHEFRGPRHPPSLAHKRPPREWAYTVSSPLCRAPPSRTHTAAPGLHMRSTTPRRQIATTSLGRSPHSFRR